MNIRSGPRKQERGQVLILFAVSLAVLLLFVGMAIDFGFAYVTRADLAKASDAASLAGALNLANGPTEATQIAQSVFAMNYSSGGRNAVPPVADISITPDPSGSGAQLVSVTANATIKTFFLGMLPVFKTMNVAAPATATRNRVVMTLVLDRSGSMNLNGGCGGLPPAVQDFIGFFSDTIDNVSVVTFASDVRTDIPMQTGGFKAPITALTNQMGCNNGFFGGGTFSAGGLQQAITEEGLLPIPAGSNVIKVVVFFTDGWANANQDVFNGCNGGKPLNYGGCSPVEANLDWCNQSGGIPFWDPTTTTTVQCGATQFPSQQFGVFEPLTPVNNGNLVQGGQLNVASEALYRAEWEANILRMQTPATVIYAIGLGNTINQGFLLQLANDPTASTYNSSQPAGEAEFVPDPSQLKGTFELVARKILLRLTQ